MMPVLSGCSSPERRTQSFGDGIGSEQGNYAAQIDGETRDEAGMRCVIVNWDRPLTRDLVVRLRSASCESKQHPFWMESREISRSVIPRGNSVLKDVPDPLGQ
ncbi:hypothetical protein TSH100_29395 [Azospirillum sp. TSH100]|nr:hypothetical protein TSH100_29395 [Azospirillum sp. TSH100]